MDRRMSRTVVPLTLLLTLLALSFHILNSSIYADEPTKNGELITMQYFIGELPVWRLDETGKPVFDASVVVSLCRQAAGRNAWGNGTKLTVTDDKMGLVVRQTKSNQQKITAAYRELCEQQGMVFSKEGETVSPDRTKANAQE